MGTILFLRLGDIIMKVIILVCRCCCRVSQCCTKHMSGTKESGRQAIKGSLQALPPGTKGDGVCEDGEGFGCIGEVTSAIASCVLQGHFDGAALFACLQEIISAAGDCYDCICWAMSYLG